MIISRKSSGLLGDWSYDWSLTFWSDLGLPFNITHTREGYTVPWRHTHAHACARIDRSVWTMQQPSKEMPRVHQYRVPFVLIVRVRARIRDIKTDSIHAALFLFTSWIPASSRWMNIFWVFKGLKSLTWLIIQQQEWRHYCSGRATEQTATFGISPKVIPVEN